MHIFWEATKTATANPPARSCRLVSHHRVDADVLTSTGSQLLAPTAVCHIAAYKRARRRTVYRRRLRWRAADTSYSASTSTPLARNRRA
jgi:hypothetical protein